MEIFFILIAMACIFEYVLKEQLCYISGLTGLGAAGLISLHRLVVKLNSSKSSNTLFKE